MSSTAKLVIAISQCILLASQAFAASLTISRPEEAGLSGERLKRIRSVVQSHIDAKDFAGAVTLVARKGKVVHFEAQGNIDLESGKPMRTDTLFRMASMTKPITAVSLTSGMAWPRVTATPWTQSFWWMAGASSWAWRTPESCNSQSKPAEIFPIAKPATLPPNFYVNNSSRKTSARYTTSPRQT